MSVTVAQLETLVRATGLDAEGSTYYHTDRHVIPAINIAYRWFLTAVSTAIGQKRLAEEAVSECIKITVFQTSTKSRIKIPTTMYSILAVYPNCTCAPNNTPVVEANAYTSLDLTSSHQYLTCENSAYRLSAEEANKHKGNPYHAGNTVQLTTTEANIIYGYISPVDYGTFGGTPAGSYIEIRPYLNQKMCAIKHIYYPAVFTATTDTIPIPFQALNLLAMKVVNILVFKQNDNSSLLKVTDNEISQLLTALN